MRAKIGRAAFRTAFMSVPEVSPAEARGQLVSFVLRTRCRILAVALRGISPSCSAHGVWIVRFNGGRILVRAGPGCADPGGRFRSAGADSWAGERRLYSDDRRSHRSRCRCGMRQIPFGFKILLIP